MVAQGVDDKGKLTSLLLLLIFILLCLIIGLRGEQVGNDTLEYYNIFYRLSYSGPDSYVYLHIDYLYRELNLLVKRLGGGPSTVILIGTILSILPYYFFFRKYSQCFWISFASFLSLGAFYFIHSGLRQSIACGIIILAYKWFSEGRWVLFITVILLAMGFHLSAFFALVYFTVKLNLDWKVILLIYAPSILFYIKPDLMNLFFQKISFIVPEKYFKYLLNIEEASRSGLGIKAFAIYLLGFTFLYGYAKTDIKEQKQIYMLSILSIAFANFFVNYSTIGRLGLYLSPFISIAFSNFFSSYIYNRDKLMVGIFYFLLFTFIFYRQSINDSYNVFLS